MLLRLLVACSVTSVLTPLHPAIAAQPSPLHGPAGIATPAAPALQDGLASPSATSGQSTGKSAEAAPRLSGVNAVSIDRPIRPTQAARPVLRRPIPDRLVVLTFDDAPVTQAAFAAPILHKYHFGATFFICEFPPHFADKTKYMSWEQVRRLDKMGFEIGNHTAFHTHVSRMSRAQFQKSLAYIEDKSKSYGIEKPTTFAYPGYDARSKDLDVLTQQGYIFARAGLERPYDPSSDNPLLVPGFNANGTDPGHVLDAIQQARNGKIVVLIFHGIPDYEHPWVTTPPGLFKQYMQFLHRNRYKVIAMRDLAKYVDPNAALQIPLPGVAGQSQAR